jgi:ankyrin repeat protein
MRLNEVIQAAKDGNAAAMKRLLAADRTLADARTDSGETPLMAAIYRGHSEVVDLLLKAGAGRDIFAASAVGNTDALEQALATNPAAVSSVAYDGWTPLHLAAFFGRTPAADRLLAAGADINAVSSNSLHNTPLHAAVAGGHVEVALRLIERGADVNSSDAGGHTPLHIAAEAGYVPIVEALLARGANPHVVDAEDRTPLARAAARNHHDVVDLINVGSGPPG